MIRVHADLRWQIESHGKTRLALVQEIAIPLIRFGSAAEARILAHGPKTAAVHRRVDPTSKRIFAGKSDRLLRLGITKGVPIIDTLNRNTGKCCEFFLALGGVGGFGFCVSHVLAELEIRKSKLDSRHPASSAAKPVSQSARLAKRRHGKKHKQQRHSDGDGDEPASCISRSRAKRGIEPAERKHCKNRADDFVKKLPERAPEAPETALSSRRSARAYCRGHENILTQNEAGYRNPVCENLLSRRVKPVQWYCGRIGDNEAKLYCIQLVVGLEWPKKYGRTGLATR